MENKNENTAGPEIPFLKWGFKVLILLAICVSVFVLLNPFTQVKKDPSSSSPGKDSLRHEPRGNIMFDGNCILDTLKSRIEWTGWKTTGMHTGTLRIRQSELHVNSGIVTSGKVSMDMNSILCSDIEDPKDNSELTEHLKDKDFFDATVFPVATFEITQVVKEAEGDGYRITGDLIIKGIRKSISFPAVIRYVENKLYASAELKINRTEFGIKYKSKSFFSDLGDKFIYDEFDLRLALVGSL